MSVNGSAGEVLVMMKTSTVQKAAGKKPISMGKQYERHKKHFIPHCALMTVKGTASVRGGVNLALRFFGSSNRSPRFRFDDSTYHVDSEPEILYIGQWERVKNPRKPRLAFTNRESFVCASSHSVIRSHGTVINPRKPRRMDKFARKKGG
jgi:hypothetical protein